MPLELRARRIAERLDQAYAHALPLSVEEVAHMSRLAACYGASVMGSGDGCATEREQARASGLSERHRIRSAAYSIPERLSAAAAKPLGANRTNDLLVANAIADSAEIALREYLHGQLNADQIATLQSGAFYVETPPAVRAYQAEPLALMLVGADLEQAIICDANDLAAGRRTGMAYDPNAPVPPGP
jgi:hypothetical protein